MLIDGHIHLENGDLTKEYVLLFVDEAIKKGLDAIQILDHTHRFKEFEVIYEELKDNELQRKWLENKTMKFKDTLPQYITLMESIKEMELPITITYGLEVCYVEKHEQTIREILANYNFDFIVGAIHSIDGILYDMSFSKELLWNKLDVDFIYKRYYEQVVSLIKSNLFTQLAHMDTIKMFNYYPKYDLTDTYNLIAKLLKLYNVKAENNVGCYYRYNHSDLGLSLVLLDILIKANVELITCSDSHNPSDVGSHIKEVTNIISERKKLLMDM